MGTHADCLSTDKTTMAHNSRKHAGGSVARIGFWPRSPFPWTDLSHGFSDGYAERGEAVQDGHADLELGDLTVEVPSG